MMIEEVKKQVYELLKNDDSGHDYKHVERVLNMSLRFAQKENVNLDILSLLLPAWSFKFVGTTHK